MKPQDTTSRLEAILKEVRSEDEIRDYVEEYTGGSYGSFSRYINEYIGQHQLSMADIIDRSNVSKNYVYNIINGDRSPGRDKIIAICIGAGMNCAEINRGLKIAQKGVLYAKDERDARIMIAVNRGVRSVTELNLILDQAGVEILE